MRSIIFDGRLGKDAEVLKTKEGKSYVRFSVANNLFRDGEEKTDWFDVTSFDSFIIEKRAQYLKKGTYVIVTGNIITEVNVSNGNVYLNHKVRATSIETPSRGKSNDEHQSSKSEAPEVSVYTGGTPAVVSAAPQYSRQEAPAPTPAASPAPAPKVSVPSEPVSNADEDDLPF